MSGLSVAPPELKSPRSKRRFEERGRDYVLSRYQTGTVKKFLIAAIEKE